ncbi:MAG: hypothetical protein SFX73_15870 [Kofleriaceae bacterium]|nr:hypothetical protein [Kofleriaceae bacterium]
MKQLLALAVLVPAFLACKSESTKTEAGKTEAGKSGAGTVAAKPIEKVAATPCETGALDLAKKLSDANGRNMDLGKPETQKVIDAAKAEIAGKTFAFSNCFFSSQGNDQVSFKANGSAEDDIECVMAGGEDGNRKFRDAAMSFDMSKLRLDVRGTVKEHGEGHFRDFTLVDCEITPHE